ncbi:MAG: 8-oxoguanine deaminase [Burkholderiaceae bacterium]|jgi:cytosine/adenosine deaminase-related metal-dependent hydrolase
MSGPLRILIRQADVLASFDPLGQEWVQGSVLTEGRSIAAIGSHAEVQSFIDADPIARKPDREIDARGCVVLPGLINGHHHLFQTLTRALGTARGHVLFDWLKLLYPIWGRMDPEAVYVSAKLGLCELILSGATTVADHLYLFPNGSRVDDEIAAAQELGVRFHPTRGSMSVGQSAGGLPPDALTESEEAILADSLRLIETFHDPSPYSMLRVGLAPCSPFSVSADLMKESARMARAHPLVGLHTHLAETLDEERYCLGRFGMRPLQYADSLDWRGEDVWFAHMVHPSSDEVAHMARHRSGVCHCPSSNMILASGIAPIRNLIDQGVRVGLGVDGSASNDGNHLLGEARQAMLLQRVGWPGFESRADRLSAREALGLATAGGARILNRPELGSLAVGQAADLVAFRVDDLEHAGAGSDPLGALLTCTPTRVWLSVIGGRIVVDQGELLGVDLGELVHRHNAISRRLLHEVGLA